MPFKAIKKLVNESERRAQVRAFFESYLEETGAFISVNRLFEITNVYYSSGRWYADYLVFEDSGDGRCGPFLQIAQTSKTQKELKDAFNEETTL